ncbi:ATP-binding protein [Bacteroidota bacterium]
MANDILIAEDSPTQREQLKFILESNGYIVHSTENGSEALELLKTVKPSLVITDILMPEMNGYELCSRIKSDPNTTDIPVLLLTSLSDPHDVIKGLQAGADNFLTKPYKEYFLLSRIRYILVNQELRGDSVFSDVGLEIDFGGEKHFINSNRMQIIDLLLSTYENAIQKNNELAEANKQLLKMHEELELSNTKLKRLSEDKSKFLRMAAHDLRNPTSTIISSSAHLLEVIQDRLSEHEKEYIDMIDKSGNFILHLLNEILDLEIIESGNLQLTLKEIELNTMLNYCISHNRAFSDKKSINIDLVSEENTLMVEIDEVKIDQVVTNLISNAIKFSHPDSSITIGLKKSEGDAVISVADKGQGIPEKEIEKLFKPFGKTSVRSTRGEDSTGLGLSIVKKIVETHNGKVWVESEVNKGSTFYFTLPLKKYS